MSYSVYLVDAFVCGPFSGNPAAVVPLREWLDDSSLAQIAAEMNQSETAFIKPTETGFHIRWFTPEVEVKLCGHATLASAHVIWNYLGYQGDKVRFQSLSGELLATHRSSMIELDFPVKRAVTAPPPSGLAEALGSPIESCFKNEFDYLIELAHEDQVLKLRPNFSALGKIECRGLIVTSKAERQGVDFVSRFFAPAVGINEDPVTGSAHCCLADYWHQRTGKSAFHAFQASKRGGKLYVELLGERVLLRGEARTTLSGELHV